jgi:hypothetical protein
MPHGEKLMPHKHPEDRVDTLISGVFYIGLGDEFDASKLKAYPPGAVIVLPGSAPHFHGAKSGECVMQASEHAVDPTYRTSALVSRATSCFLPDESLAAVIFGSPSSS